jgi:hypothetical protein
MRSSSKGKPLEKAQAPLLLQLCDSTSGAINPSYQRFSDFPRMTESMHSQKEEEGVTGYLQCGQNSRDAWI